MPLFRSIVSKLIIIGLIVLSFFIFYVYIGFTFTEHIRGDATRMNIAGRQRMLTVSMALRIAVSLYGNVHQVEKEALTKGVEGIISEYEEALYGLRD